MLDTFFYIKMLFFMPSKDNIDCCFFKDNTPELILVIIYLLISSTLKRIRKELQNLIIFPSYVMQFGIYFVSLIFSYIYICVCVCVYVDIPKYFSNLFFTLTITLHRSFCSYINTFAAGNFAVILK